MDKSAKLETLKEVVALLKELNRLDETLKPKTDLKAYGSNTLVNIREYIAELFETYTYLDTALEAFKLLPKGSEYKMVQGLISNCKNIKQYNSPHELLHNMKKLKQLKDELKELIFEAQANLLNISSLIPEPNTINNEQSNDFKEKALEMESSLSKTVEIVGKNGLLYKQYHYLAAIRETQQENLSVKSWVLFR